MEGINKVITTVVSTVNSDKTDNNSKINNSPPLIKTENKSANSSVVTSKDEQQIINMLEQETESQSASSSKNEKEITYKRSYDEKTGLTTLEKYSDGKKIKAKNDTKCYILKTDSNEAGYKFATGNKNTVHIADNGDSLEVQISKGMLSKTIKVNKNDDGTYSYRDTTLTSLDEIACIANNTKLKPNYAEDGTINDFQQSLHGGECGTASTIMAGSDIFKDNIIYNNNGTVTVKLPGLGENYSVTVPRINKIDKMGYGSLVNTTQANGDAEPIYIMEAMKTALNSEEFEFADEYPSWCKQDSRYGASPIKGRFPQFAAYLLTGKIPNERIYIANADKEDLSVEDKQKTIEDNQKAEELFSDLKNNKDTIVTVQFPRSALKEGARHDAFGGSISFKSGHEYGIKSVEAVSDSETIQDEDLVIIVNSQRDVYEAEEIVMKWGDFKAMRPAVDSIQLEGNNTHPMYFRAKKPITENLQAKADN